MALNPFDKIHETLNRSERIIATLGTNVTDYSRNVADLTALHQIIAQYMLQSEDSMHYLIKLNQELFDELEQVEKEHTTIVDTSGGLSERIRELEAEVQRLNTMISTTEAQVRDQLQGIQIRANTQATQLENIGKMFTDANNQFSSSFNDLSTLWSRVSNLKRQRDDTLGEIDAKRQRRATLQNRLRDLNRERQALQTMLTAVQTLPSTLPTGPTPPTGPESPGGGDDSDIDI